MRFILGLLMLALSIQNAAQAPSPGGDANASLNTSDGKVYICPMDPDVRSNSPGKCDRCGMALVAGLPDPVEYHMDLKITPRPLKAGVTANLTFFVHDPTHSNRPRTCRSSWSRIRHNRSPA